MTEQNNPIALSNLCQELEQPPVIETGRDWADAIRTALDAGDVGAARMLLDNEPAALRDLDKVGATHLIMPNAANVTEEMLDAPRGVMLYTDVMNDHNASYIRKMLLADTHYAKHLPQWFLEMEGHMTKADRLHLIYTLTIAGHIDPEPPMPKALPNRRKRQAFTLSIYLKGREKCLTLTREYEGLFALKDLVGIDLKVNRHELPEDWRNVFRKQAIDLSLVLSKDNGIYKVTNSRIRLGTKSGYEGRIHADIDDGSAELLAQQ